MIYRYNPIQTADDFRYLQVTYYNSFTDPSIFTGYFMKAGMCRFFIAYGQNPFCFEMNQTMPCNTWLKHDAIVPPISRQLCRVPAYMHDNKITVYS
jgi:hypothetical protein